MKTKNLTLASLILAIVTGCSTAPKTVQHDWIKDKEYKLTILHTNDITVIFGKTNTVS